MQQVIEFFSGLFSTDSWPPRWRCGYWSDFHGWMYIISDLLIWLSYFLIPVIILQYISRKKAVLKFNKAYIYFAAFILLCGTTHFIDALMFWYPMYRFNGLVRMLTASVSLATVYHLVLILPQAFNSKTSLELEAEVLRRKEAERKLEEANNGLEAFAYMVSHDLKEPLRKINYFTTQLKAQNKEVFDESSRTYSEKIINYTDRMHLLIEDILKLSLIDANVELVNVDLNKPIKNALDVLELQIKDQNAVIKIGSLPNVRGNETYLSQLFINLIGNALKFNSRVPFIEINGKMKDGMVWITVADNGIGMDQSESERIFDSFHRLNAHSAYEGTGIGLSIVKKIVKVHKGEIFAVSKPGLGTTFHIGFKA